MAALIPGLAVQVEGKTTNDQNQLVATASVRFKGNDLEDAQKDGSWHATKARCRTNSSRHN